MSSLRSPSLVVGMPIYNAENFVAEAIRSILGQSFDDFVLLISDNASTDSTAQICQSFVDADPRVVYVRQDRNIGANANFNEVARLAEKRYQPTWFKWAAHDDVCEPRFFETCIKVLETEADVVLTYPVTVMIDEHGKPIPGAVDPGPKGVSADRIERFHSILRDEFGVFYIFGVVRMSALMSTTLFGPYWPPDKALSSWLTLLGRFVQVPEPLFLRRAHPAQSSSLTLREQAKWSTSGLGRFVPSPVWATRAYLQGIRSAPLSVAERRAALKAVGQKYVDLGKWKRVLLPGRDNYLGWSGRERGTAVVRTGSEADPVTQPS